MSYAAYVWSALAVFLLGLTWDFLAPTLKTRALKRRKAQQDLMNSGESQ